MKELHMICNAHLDPVWLRQRPEGIYELVFGSFEVNTFKYKSNTLSETNMI